MPQQQNQKAPGAKGMCEINVGQMQILRSEDDIKTPFCKALYALLKIQEKDAFLLPMDKAIFGHNLDQEGVEKCSIYYLLFHMELDGTSLCIYIRY